MSGIDSSYTTGKVILQGTPDVQSYALLGMWTSLFSFLDIRTCIRLSFLDIDLPDRILIDVEVLVGLAGRTSSFRNVLLVRMKDVEYGVKFA
jgi:hypothetical protein